MSATAYLELYVHLVWATWDRRPLITAEIEEVLRPALIAKATELGCTTLAVGGIEDHFHDFLALAPCVPISRVVQELKGASSHLLRRLFPEFRWQGGYGAFTVAKTDVPRVIRYVENQREHHRTGRLSRFLEEMRAQAQPWTRPGQLATAEETAQLEDKPSTE